MDQPLHHHHAHELHTYEAPPPGTPLDTGADDEGPALPRRPRLADGELDLTPMIDMTFLLLIFFLVASKMSTQADVKLPIAKHGLPVDITKAVVITVRESAGAAPAEVYLGDSTNPATKCKAKDATGQEDEIAQYVEDTLVRENKLFVVVKATRAVAARDVQRVADAIARVDSVEALHVAVLDEG